MKKTLFCVFLLIFYYKAAITQAISVSKSYYSFYMKDGIHDTFDFQSQGFGSYYFAQSKYVKKNDHQLKLIQITIGSGHYAIPFTSLDDDLENIYIKAIIESFDINGKEI